MCMSAFGAEFVIFGKLGNFDQFAAQILTCVPGRRISGIAGDEHMIHPECFCQSEQQPAGFRGIMMPPVFFLDFICDMTAVIEFF